MNQADSQASHLVIIIDVTDIVYKYSILQPHGSEEQLLESN